MKATAGTYESSDCLIEVLQNDSIKLTIESIVFDQFGEAIKQVLLDTINSYKINNIHVICKDKGALDYTIKSRLETALKRGGFIE